MDFILTAEQQAVRALARDFAARKLAPHVEQWESEGIFHRHIIEMIGARGLYGCAFPESFGGTGKGFLAQALIIEEITRQSIEAGYTFNCQAISVPVGISNWASEEMVRHIVPRLLKGEYVGCFSLTESESGSDAAAVKCRAIRDGANYIIKGTKTWATYGNVADVILLITKTQPELGAKGATAFCIRPTALSGFSSARIPSSIGSRCIPSAQLVFDDCRIPASWRVGEEGDGFKVAMNAMDYGRITVSSRALGLAQAAIDHSIKYANERMAFGQQIGKFQMIQHLIADMVVDTEATRLMVYRLATLADSGRSFTRESAQGKYFATEAGVRVTGRAMEVLGGYAFHNEYVVQRLHTFAKLMLIGEGSANIQRIRIAEDVLGYKRMSRHNIPAKCAALRFEATG